MKKRIVIITDCIDVAFNELRATILNSINDHNNIEIEPLVPVVPFSVINANFVLRLMAETYSKKTIFSIIVNPLRKRPARLIGKTKKKDFLFISANTGALDWFLRDFGVSELYELYDPGFFPFGGKYVHAPAIAQIASDKPLKELGKPFNKNDLLKLKLSEGTIVHIDNFGIIKFIGTLAKYKEGDKFEIRVNNKNIKAVYAKRMMNRKTGEWVIYPGSSLGLPELGRVRMNGIKDLNVKIGDIITFKKCA
jgi:S-adenosylmethionine hydrolase